MRISVCGPCRRVSGRAYPAGDNVRPGVTGDHGAAGGLVALDHPVGRTVWLFRVLVPLLVKWLITGSAITIVTTAVNVLISSVDPRAPAAVQAISSVGSDLGTIALPVCLGLAILKYRLYDIDRIISRTLAYAIVTGLLVGLYSGVVLLTTEVFRIHTPVSVAVSTLAAAAVAVSTLAAAAVFNPLRRRVQHAVDRRFNRARYDADLTITAFAARLKEEVDLNSVQADLAGVVARALEPAHVPVWLSRRD